MSNPFQHDALSEIKKTLFKLANESKWEEVIETYHNNKEAHTAKITSSGDTALHIAISNGEEAVVKDLVAIVRETEGALEMQNEHGNTPLHLAAYLGNASMCRSIAGCKSELMGLRNGDNETPFFLAVRHGRKEAFYALHEICKGEECYDYCRGKDGETILHSAISGEYFDLAFYIINHYKKLLNAVTEQGFSPLHILANKPSAFKSGSQIRGLDKLVYLCIFVDELQLDNLEAKPNKDLRFKEENPTYPQNYHTCAVTFDLLRHATLVLLGRDYKSGNQNQKKQQEGDHNEKHDEGKKPAGDCSEKRDEVVKQQHIVTVLCGSRNAEAERRQYLDAPCIKAKGSNNRDAQGHELFPNNYTTFFNIVKLISKTMLVILGLGSKSVEKMREKKTKHIWSFQIMEKLLEHAKSYEYEANGKIPGISAPAEKDGAAISYTLSNIAGAGADAADLNLNMIDDIDHELDNPVEKHQPHPPPDQNSTVNQADRDDKKCCREMVCTVLNSLGLVKMNPLLKKLCWEKVEMEMEKKETPILVAARNGVVEIVEGILRLFPVAIHDVNNDNKNVVLLAVEHRQPHVYKFLDDRKIMKETIFRKTDKDGNSALHLAARLGEYRPWLIPGAALQMQWEIKWYEFVKNSMSPHFFPRHNNDSKTARDIFTETHGELVKEGGAWLTNTSQSCSVVAALIATVAFATSATVPGGVKSDSGTPTLQNEPAFNIFAISSLVALCFSVTSVVMFLAILTSRHAQIQNPLHFYAEQIKLINQMLK
ncbi:hypothetical protein C2S52_021141 [Perilla frutescens var. hirtella]|nr:hypothetical protein C2S52_021141 [Perilla frutescens var. hirtella]